MKTEQHQKLDILAEVRKIKEEIASEHNYDIEAIVKAARERQEQSGRRIIRTSKHATRN